MPALTRQQRRIAELLMCGLDNRAIGRQVGLSSESVKNRIHAMLELFGMDDRVQLALCLHENRGNLGISCPCDFGGDPVESSADLVTA